MSIFVVSKNHLVRDMIASILESRNQQVKAVYESASKIGSTLEEDIVLLHDPPTIREAKADIDMLRLGSPSLRLILVPKSEFLPAFYSEFSTIVAAIIPEDSSAEALLSAVIMVNEGFTVSALDYHPTLQTPDAANVINPVELAVGSHSKIISNLSEQETRVLKLIASGASNKAIALNLGIAEATVKSHLRSSFLKTGCKNRALAAVWASMNL